MACPSRLYSYVTIHTYSRMARTARERRILRMQGSSAPLIDPVGTELFVCGVFLSFCGHLHFLCGCAEALLSTVLVLSLFAPRDRISSSS